MSKKTSDPAGFIPTEEEMASTQSYTPAAESDGNEEKALSDFDVDGDYKVDPLVPNGNYHGYVNAVKLDKGAVAFTIVLSENGGVLSDGETALDGASVFFRLWLPTMEDKTTPTKSGRGTKWQWKVNNMKKVSDALDLGITNIQSIKDAIAENRWVGIECMVAIVTDEYEGEVRNQVNKMLPYIR